MLALRGSRGVGIDGAMVPLWIHSWTPSLIFAARWVYRWGVEPQELVPMGSGTPRIKKIQEFSEWSCLYWKVRRILLAYLEASNTILGKKKKIVSFYKIVYVKFHDI